MFSYKDVEDIELNDNIYSWDLSEIELRTLLVAQWLIDNKSSTRGVAKEFCIGKSTVHRDLMNRLPKLSIVLYDQVKTIMRKNRSTRFH